MALTCSAVASSSSARSTAVWAAQFDDDIRPLDRHPDILDARRFQIELGPGEKAGVGEDPLERRAQLSGGTGDDDHSRSSSDRSPSIISTNPGGGDRFTLPS